MIEIDICRGCRRADASGLLKICMQAMNPVKTPRNDNRFLKQRSIRTCAIGLICHVIDANRDQAEHLSAQRRVTERRAPSIVMQHLYILRSSFRPSFFLGTDTSYQIGRLRLRMTLLR